MTSEQHFVLFPAICVDMVRYIMEKEAVTESEATRCFYQSRLYSLLEQEDMKLWQYSTPMLYSLLRQEQETGTIEFPDT